MKLAGFLGVLVFGLFVFISCQRELSFENVSTAGVATGTLKSSAGDCLPSSQVGAYKKGVEADSSDFINVDVNVISAGSYMVTSDTINGMFFQGSGVFDKTGVFTVPLYAYGVPITNGTVPYNIKYGGQSCAFILFIKDSSTTAGQYYYGNTNGSCIGVVLGGTYKAGVAMTSSNTVMLEITVTTMGSYSISTGAINGVTFSATGSFTSTGTQQVKLTATGTPAVAGNFSFPLTGSINGCSFQVQF